MKRIFKNKKGTVLTEALISMFILGTLFVSIATAVTVSISNTKKLQEVNETSAYAQKIVDCIYAIAQSDSEAFFSEIEQAEQSYFIDCRNNGNFAMDCQLNLDTIAQQLEYRELNGEENVITLYDMLNFYNEDPNNLSGEAEMTEYSVKLYLLPSYRTDEAAGAHSVNYFVSYNPLLTSNLDGGRVFNASELDDVYTFKLVVSKTVNTVSAGSVDFTQSSPASVTYIFQISSNGG